VNLKDERGREIVLRLARQSDVFLENYRPGTVEKLGLSYARVREANPRIIYCSISGFGQTGPYRERGGFDLIAQGMGGLMSVTGEAGRPPVKAGFPVTDIGAGMWAAIGILAAYAARERTGQGQQVDTSLLECPIAWSVWEAALYFATGQIPGPLGSAHRHSAPYQAFKCQDGVYINIGAAPQNLWQGLCQLLGLEHLLEDPRFETNALRHQHLQELAPILQEVFLTRPSGEWLEALTAAGIPCGPINTIDKVFADPQVQHRQMLLEVEHPIAGRLRTIGIPVKLSETPGEVRCAAPLLGQHTTEVLQWLGYSEEEIQALRRDGVI